MKLFKNILVVSSLLASINIFAAETQNIENGEYQIQKVTIEEVETPVNSITNYDITKGAAGIAAAGQVIEIVDKLMAIGERVWKIVDSGKPVLHDSGVTPSVSILPRSMADSGSLYEMYGWREPIVKTYKVTYENLYTADVVDFTFSVIMQYGGTDGKGGLYISGLSIVPDSVYVAWGWSFDATTRLINISNRGTAGKPVAAAVMELGYTVGSPLNTVAKKIRFFVDANGKISMLN